MVVEEVKIAVWTPERVGFLNRHLQVGARNILVDRLTQMVIGNRIIKDQVADRLQQLAVRFRRLSDRRLVILQGFSGLLMTRDDADIKNIDTLVRQVDQRLLQKRQQNGIATLRPHPTQGLHRILASQSSQELLAVGIES